MNFGKKLRWFTLVEMLIVIVIIWVLAAALIPRLTSVRWRANDVARKADLQQVATAIVSYSMDKWEYPTPANTWWSAISTLAWEWTDKLWAYMTVMPKDPTMDTTFNEYSASTWWDYVYLRIAKWWSANQWFALISRAQTEWWANRLYIASITWSKIVSTMDSQNVTPCSSMTKWLTWTLNMWWDCIYTADAQLRYIIVR